MIRFGPAGIPLSCKGRTLQDGIEDVHNLSLNALEVQMVRPSAYTRPPEDEEVGLTLKDISEDFVIEILRDDEFICDPDEPIEEDDDLFYMPSSVTDTFGELFTVGRMAKRLDVNLSIHTPYYMDLGSNNDMTELCLNSIRHAGIILNAMGGDIVVTSAGIYDGSMPEEEVDDNIVNNLAFIVDWWKDNNIKPRLGIEVTGQQDVFGSLDQVLNLCDALEGAVVPVVNFAHHHARTGGTLLDVDDFLNILETVEPYSNGRIHTAFTGVDYNENGERRQMPIKKGDMRFDPLAEALIEMKPDATVISTSPLLEHDAMYMKIIYERALVKKVSRDMKERKKAEAAAAAAAAGE